LSALLEDSVGRQGYVVLTYKFKKENRRWVGYCEELGTSTFGRSIPETEKKLDGAVQLHLNALEELGERENFFKENDISFHVCEPCDTTINLSLSDDCFVHPCVHKIVDPEIAFA